MKVLLVGSKGQLAHDVGQIMGSASHTIYGVDLPEVDITRADHVMALVRAERPDLIVNCAAYTKVDACETHRDLAMAVNANGPRHLAAAARETRGFLIHISTDYVFDGQRQVPQPYIESDPTGPQCHYGVTKLAGEQAVIASGARHAILRTAWLYGAHGHNFPKIMLKQALHHPGREMKVVNDQHGSPTWSWRLAHQIARVAEAGAEGLFHATAEGWCTWYEFAHHFLTRMGVPFQMRPCASSEYATAARRPHNSILENRRLHAAGINVMVDWRSDVDAFVAAHREHLMREMGL